MSEKRSGSQWLARGDRVGLVTHVILDRLGEILVDAESLVEMLAQLGAQGLRQDAIEDRPGEIDRDDERNDRREHDGERKAALRSTQDRHG